MKKAKNGESDRQDFRQNKTDSRQMHLIFFESPIFFFIENISDSATGSFLLSNDFNILCSIFIKNLNGIAR